MIVRQIELFFCALTLLTRTPLPELTRFEPDWITRSARWYSVIGQFVGAAASLALVGAAWLWNGSIAAFVAVAAAALLTGALHERALAGAADGPDAAPDRRIGASGAAALILAIGLKVAALAALPTYVAAAALLAVHGLARAALATTMALARPAPDAVADEWTPAGRGVTGWEAAVAVALSLWPLAFLPPMAVVAGLAGGAGLALVTTGLAKRRIGGHTGAMLGTVEQVFEVGFLLGVAAVPIL